MQGKRISIIGCGSVGTCICRVLVSKGLDVTIANRTAAHIPQDIGAEICDIVQGGREGDIVLLAVSDDAIKPLCDELANQKAFKTNAVVAHLSGALDSTLLESAKQKCKCSTGSIHPLQTFPSNAKNITSIAGAYCFIEGDEIAARELTQLAEIMETHPVVIEPENKTLYHAACVTACNYLTCLLDASVEMLQQAGVDEQTAIKALGPIVSTTVENNLKFSPQGALTGPIARGDVQTVEKHLQTLKQNNISPELQKIYRVLGQWATKISKADPQKLNLINTLLHLPED